MPDYSKGIIYTIRSRDSVYVGSTIDFRSRKKDHKSVIYNENSKQYNYKLYKNIRKNNGEWDMQPYSQYPCKSKLELTIKEEKIRQLLKADLNMLSCGSGLTRKEYVEKYREEHKDEIEKYKKQYYEEHKDEISEKQKQYNDQHKDKISEQKKQYTEQNKDKISEKKKQWYEQNKDKISEKKKQKITCACGCVVVKSTLPRHHKTKKHINLMEKLNQ
jgi:hypothetical protein